MNKRYSIIQEPAVKVFALGGQVRGISVDRSGTYMATSNVSGIIRIWDIRNLKVLHEYKVNF